MNPSRFPLAAPVCGAGGWEPAGTPLSAQFSFRSRGFGVPPGQRGGPRPARTPRIGAGARVLPTSGCRISSPLTWPFVSGASARRDVWKSYSHSCSRAGRGSHSAEAAGAPGPPRVLVSGSPKLSGHAAPAPLPLRPPGLGVVVLGAPILTGARGIAEIFGNQNPGQFCCRPTPHPMHRLAGLGGV